MVLVRVWLPAAIAVAGVVLLIVGGDSGRGAGVLLLGVALLVVLANLFVRLSIQSEREREQEEENRRRGVWPDEP
jgi:drug/metabolite transporter (DMT)-like permease